MQASLTIWIVLLAFLFWKFVSESRKSFPGDSEEESPGRSDSETGEAERPCDGDAENDGPAWPVIPGFPPVVSRRRPPMAEPDPIEPEVQPMLPIASPLAPLSEARSVTNPEVEAWSTAGCGEIGGKSCDERDAERESTVEELRERFDLRRAVLYSEILKPRFEEE